MRPSVSMLVALLFLALATVAFGFYVTNFSNHGRNYGTLAGVIVFLSSLWIASGALPSDAELERGRQLQAGIEAEENIQLPACPRHD